MRRQSALSSIHSLTLTLFSSKKKIIKAQFLCLLFLSPIFTAVFFNGGDHENDVPVLTIKTDFFCDFSFRIAIENYISIRILKSF